MVLLLNTTRKPIRIHQNVRLGYFTTLSAEDNTIDMSDMFSGRESSKTFTFSKDTESPHVHKISDTFPTNLKYDKAFLHEDQIQELTQNKSTR